MNALQAVRNNELIEPTRWKKCHQIFRCESKFGEFFYMNFDNHERRVLAKRVNVSAEGSKATTLPFGPTQWENTVQNNPMFAPTSQHRSPFFNHALATSSSTESLQPSR